jgi:hypothetical protein
MDRKTLITVAVALALGYWVASSSGDSPRPADRPVVRWIARAAKNLLWVALLAEKPPEGPQPDHHYARAERVGDDGYPLIDNARGW